ncbi:Probable nucleoredoxin 1 [Seminavis robusta]|uniref:Probable nucleoredoxin 1 n=1 Tax=Seminavis robusta TaxID=568900 RepID=A0A9N8DR08_9STRA|nr:Probable nucleoredoxin 1 [Seminavis robusta]|eukprot:Sro309_g113840.1 Probable nucleoredoxin 1 (299) ;mRNA; r:46789-47780
MVASTNPKKKHTYVTKDSPKDKKEVVKASDGPSGDEVASASDEMIEQHFGPSLLTSVGGPSKPTTSLFKGKELIALYFSASWSHSCEKFTPKLVDFYNKVGKDNGMEVVFISSDNDRPSFEEYYGKMPWLALDGDEKSVGFKHALATNLKAFRLPTLIILNLQTGNFVTNLARKEVMALTNPVKGPDGNDAPVTDKEYVERGKDLLASWKEREPTPIGDSTSTVESVQAVIDYFFQNPMMAVLVVCMLTFTSVIKRVMDNPLLGVAFWFVLKNFATERLARNEPYIVQEALPDDKKKQ